ncbi:MAG: iron-containing alcohol dehydrogenase [Elusimicrobia bacterium]|nr:iron-containing alcohol dehydrogenase [Elusimicrobiota bacterium]
MNQPRLRYDPARIEELNRLIQAAPEAKSFEPITLKTFLAGQGAVLKIPGLLDTISAGRAKTALVVSDETPINLGPALLRDFILNVFRESNRTAECLILKADDTGLLHADMGAVSQIKARLETGTGVVALGGGTIADISKYAVFLKRQEGAPPETVPLLVCQTATSGSAFGSNQSVIFKDGVKRTLHSAYPDAVVADSNIIAGGPRRLNASGLGDMTGILVSNLDWHMSHVLGMSSGYSGTLVDIMIESGRAVLEIGPQVGAMSAEGLETLGKILTLMGIVSSLGYGTAPISGFEHMISHALDMQGLALGRKLSLHGAQVGLGTAYAGAAYRLFVREFTPNRLDLDRCYPGDEESRRDIEVRFSPFDREGKIVKEIWDHYREKLVLWRKQRPLFEKLLHDWD